MSKILILPSISIIICANIFAQRPGSGSKASKTDCPATKLCDEFEIYSYECLEHKEFVKCRKFVKLFERLIEFSECPELSKSKVKSSSLPDIWLCAKKKASMPLDIHYTTLSKLKFKEALKLYSSKEFRETLDGHIASEHFKKSIELEKELVSEKPKSK